MPSVHDGIRSTGDIFVPTDINIVNGHNVPEEQKPDLPRACQPTPTRLNGTLPERSHGRSSYEYYV